MKTLNIFLVYLRMFIGNSFIFLTNKLYLAPIKILPTKIRKVSFSIEPTDTVSVMSYNIHTGRDHIYRNSLDKIIADIEMNRQSVLCLQELTIELYTHCKDSLGYEYGYYDHNKCILSDFPIIDRDIHFFNTAYLDSRTSLISVCLQHGEEQVCVINTLFSYDITLLAQMAELKELQHYIEGKQLYTDKLVVIGDFNLSNLSMCKFKSDLAKVLKLDEVLLEETYPSLFPIMPIDKCFTTNMTVTKSAVIQTYNSTHCPICIEF